MTRVRAGRMDDVAAIAAVHRQAFKRQRDSDEWVRATLAASPRLLVFVVELNGVVAGYAFWAEKSGLRPAAILELDQVAVADDLRGRGLGATLIRDSLALAVDGLARQGRSLHAVLVSTSVDNPARRLYQRVLGVTPVATIEGLYARPEVLLMARRPS